MNPLPDAYRVLTALYDGPATFGVVAARSGLDLDDVRLWLDRVKTLLLVEHDDHGVWSLTGYGRELTERCLVHQLQRMSEVMEA